MAADVLRYGDEIYQTFSGTYKTTTKPDGSWEVSYQGVSVINVGTGAYKNAKGAQSSWYVSLAQETE